MRRYDVIVVGAGVAGSLAAREFARRGHGVLLVERERFPREKVCGGCLGSVALDALHGVGLGELPERCGATPVERFDWRAGRRRAVVPLAGGVVLSRATLDEALVNEARAAGVEFMDGVRAGWAEAPVVQLADSDRVEARLVVVATGLGGGKAARGSLVGAGAVFDADRRAVEPGVVEMTHARDGYVGVARAERDRLLVAAALRGRAIRRWGIEGAVARILAKSGRPPLPSGAAWRGTPLLTRRVRPTRVPGVVRVGDSTGYVEPFTGEGMGWAMRSAAWLGAHWRPEMNENWQARLDAMLAPSRRRCRMLTGALHWPGAAAVAITALQRYPRMVRTASAWVSPS